ncbi:MAG: OmcA/MtrC family decaheme c-type cytochrome [Chloroflexi bacterium]|nr:OmcA/MtrC family decaheme c-type cytochrome [Chloroflexota bacterium]
MIARRIAILAASVIVATAAVAILYLWDPPLATSQVAGSAGGVQLKILSASIPADRKPVVTFTLADAGGNPLRIAELDQGGLRFLIASIQTDPETRNTRYVNYVVSNVPGRDFRFAGKTTRPALASASQAGVDTGGTFAELGGGKFTYTFGTVLPADFDARATHTVAGYATRAARAFVSNDAFDFVPAGGEVQVRREVVKTDACNACHTNLAAHGGTRRDTRLCVLCHTSQTTDPETGNPVEFKVLVHKIHSGARLPSVVAGTPYFIVGFGQNAIDFSGIRWPQDTRNCQTCHQGAQAENFKTRPSAEACGACHDRSDFSAGPNHSEATRANSTCANCHKADGPEFGESVTGAHTIPEKSKQLRGVNFQIVSFTDTQPGQSPTVTFNIKDKAGQPIEPSEMASLSLVLAGPTTDYANAVSENANRATPTDDGNFSYTFNAKIPDDAAGTYAVGIQGFLAAELRKASGELLENEEGSTQIRDVGFNKVAFGAVTDSVPMPRKRVVDLNNCNRCHETLALHGGTRRNTEFCVLCHNPNATDSAKRTQANGPQPPQSIVFNRLIHRIHTGEEQQDKPFIIFGGAPNNPQPVNLSEARFPADRRECTKCHLPNSNLLDFMRQGIQPATVRQDDTVVSVTQPIQTLCTGCHDSKAAVAHADTMTASGGREACTVCHGERGEFAVSAVHRR